MLSDECLIPLRLDVEVADDTDVVVAVADTVVMVKDGTGWRSGGDAVSCCALPKGTVDGAASRDAERDDNPPTARVGGTAGAR